MFPAHSLLRAGRWFLESGIQNPQGGVARYYRADLQRNKPVSTEITGYAASALVYLYRATGDVRYLERAKLAADFLATVAWDSALQAFPYEYPSPTQESLHRAYFFDSGIIMRGLLAVWSETRNDSLIEVATEAAHGMLRDFSDGADGEFHPVLVLPGKAPLERAGYWSSSAACYQAKSALAWWELAEITGDTLLRQAYLRTMEAALRSYREFLPGTEERTGIMDRLHAYCYFLEAMWPLLKREDCRDAYCFTMQAVGSYLREIAPEFARSDVYAQLLRARLFASAVLTPDETAACEEAGALRSFQIESDDQRLDGGFYFGQREGVMVAHANPVSTAFAIQALHMWEARGAGEINPCQMPPI